MHEEHGNDESITARATNQTSLVSQVTFYIQSCLTAVASGGDCLLIPFVLHIPTHKYTFNIGPCTILCPYITTFFELDSFKYIGIWGVANSHKNSINRHVPFNNITVMLNLPALSEAEGFQHLFIFW